MRYTFSGLSLILTAVIGVGGCFSLPASPALADPGMQDVLQKTSSRELPPKFSPVDAEALKKIYADNSHEPLWMNDGGVGLRARVLGGALVTSYRHGLNPEDYHASTIQAGLGSVQSLDDLFKLDVLLTDGLMRYVQDVYAGRVNPKQVRGGSHLQRPSVDPEALVRAAATTKNLGAYLIALPPQSDIYKSQVRALETLRNSPEWGTIPGGGKLEPGSSSARVTALRQRLAATNELGAASPEGNVFDQALLQAVRDYQERNGLAVDGIVGPATLRELNTTRDERIEQMIANMERERWLPRDMGQRYVLVNIPAFELFAIRNGQVDLKMKTIVGRIDRQTPVFSDKIKYLDFNPTWSVPPTIATRDVLPHLKKDPGYALVHKNLHIYRNGREIDPYSVDWSTANIHNYTLRAPPGPRNPLGTVKFMFPNSFSVYLHDTSSPSKFNKGVRALSSGCVRVAKPADLANWLLADKPGWSDAKRQAILRSGKLTRVRLDEHVPVWMTYTTAWGDAEGRPVFRPDIYRHDVSVMSAVRRAYGPARSAVASPGASAMRPRAAVRGSSSSGDTAAGLSSENSLSNSAGKDRAS